MIENRGPMTLADWEPRPIAPSLITGLVLTTVAATLAAVAMSAPLVRDQIFWGALVLAVFCVALLLLMSVMTGSQGLGLAAWRIGPWTLTWASIAFGLATLSWLGPQTGSSVEVLPGSVVRALWMITVATTMLTAGYCVGPYRVAAANARRATGALARRFTDDIRGPAVPWVLFGVGSVAQAATAALTGYFGYVGDVAASVSTASGYQQYLAVVGECVPLAVATAAIRAYRIRTPGAWITLAILFTAAIVAGAIAGGKESFIVVILAVLIPRATIRRRFPVGLLTTAILFFLLVVIPFNLAYRASARGAVTLSTSQAVAAAPAIAGQVLSDDLSPSALQHSADILAQRVRAIDSPAIIMQRTPGQIPYTNPVQLAISPVVDLVPRILWPGKPILAVGYQVSQEYYQLPPQVYTSSSVTPEGDLYRHGGWIPVIAGMFLGGCGLRVLDEATDLRRSVHGAFLIILLLPVIVQQGTDCSSLLAGIPGTIVLWAIVIALSFGRRADPPVRPDQGRRARAAFS